MRVSVARSQGYAKFVGVKTVPRRAIQPRCLPHKFTLPAPRRRRSATHHLRSTAAGASAAAAVGVACPTCPAPPLFQDGWPLWCLLTLCGAIAQVCEARTRWGAALSAPLLSMLCAVALAAGGVIPVDCAAYDTVWRFLMPLAAACFLLETDVQRLMSDGGPLLAAFAVGAAGMVLGALVGWWLLREPLGPGGAKLAACLCASYVGGSVNFAAVALALQVPASAIPAAMAADNLLMAVFLAALMAVPVNTATAAAATAAATATAAAQASSYSPATPSSDPEDRTVSVAGGAAQGSGAAGEAEAEAAAAPPPPPPSMTAESLGLTLAAATASCATAQHLAQALNAVPLTLLILAGLAATLAAAAQWVRGAWAAAAGTATGRDADRVPRGPVFAGAAQLGTCLMMLFFAVIGASAGSLSCLATSSCGVLVAFLLVMVAVHWAVVAAVGRAALRLPMEALILGSNANIGGPATAAAMAAAKGWRPLIQPAMLAGSLGYATGTAAGLVVARLVGGG